AQRRQEMGIRMALGAARSDIVRSVVAQGLVLAGYGIVVGLIVAFGFTRVMATLLYDVGTHDLGTFVLIPIVFAIIAALASYFPARRAIQVDPADALRHG